MGHNSPCDSNTEIVQKILLLVAPSVFAATIYMILGRTIIAVQAAHLSPIRPSLLTKIFVTGDVICFCVQLGGAAIMSGANLTSVRTGRYIILAGLGLQIFLFGLFVFVATIFHMRIRKERTDASNRPEIQWEVMIMVLYVVSGVIMVRNLFRVVETAGGRDGYLLSHEWPLFVFDGILMVCVMVILLYYFPTFIRPRRAFGMDGIETQPVLSYKHRNPYLRFSSPAHNDNNINSNSD
ncbi:hypothetical protein LTR84_001245 [Exophiala bonariae]|uniref:Uncharacterized protein n=1 Tax=Exophiala bonariae TaxID=1690606 RepID=A0AAV9NW95_9EURO|nr:hypothetical protein LTR84_001245 [Exophiala bonariae]